VVIFKRTAAMLHRRTVALSVLQNNLVDNDRLAEAVQASQDTGRALEEIVLERELISPPELARARYYLAHSTEIQSRLKDVLDARGVSRPLPIPGRLLAARGLAIAGAAATFGLALPSALG